MALPEPHGRFARSRPELEYATRAAARDRHELILELVIRRDVVADHLQVAGRVEVKLTGQRRLHHRRADGSLPHDAPATVALVPAQIDHRRRGSRKLAALD